jgi:Protein of unknown function (DUF1587)
MLHHRPPADGRCRSRLRRLGFAVLVVLGGRSAVADEPPAPVGAFVTDHCATRYNDVTKKGGLDLIRREFDPGDPANLAVWIMVHDRVKAGEMPPATRRRLNRHEYENALRDPLGVRWARLADRLPEDGEAHHFNKSAEALDVSYPMSP